MILMGPFQLSIIFDSVIHEWKVNGISLLLRENCFWEILMAGKKGISSVFLLFLSSPVIPGMY